MIPFPGQQHTDRADFILAGEDIGNQRPQSEGLVLLSADQFDHAVVAPLFKSGGRILQGFDGRCIRGQHQVTKQVIAAFQRGGRQRIQGQCAAGSQGLLQKCTALPGFLGAHGDFNIGDSGCQLGIFPEKIAFAAFGRFLYGHQAGAVQKNVTPLAVPRLQQQRGCLAPGFGQKIRQQ